MHLQNAKRDLFEQLRQEANQRLHISKTLEQIKQIDVQLKRMGDISFFMKELKVFFWILIMALILLSPLPLQVPLHCRLLLHFHLQQPL